VHNNKKYDGYKLTYLGYDYLALHVFMKRGTVAKVHCKIGVGKESDIYSCEDEHGEVVILKLARLGRTSFRTIKNNRDYIKHRCQFNWLYLSRLASVKEFGFMEILFKNGFPTPIPKDWNRHGIVMSLIDGFPMA
jgi:RIO kinase 2